MDNSSFEFEYVELSQSGVSDEVIRQFDCGNQDMTDYLHNQAKIDAMEGNGVTYVLVTSDRERIYAYATIKAYGLYYYDDAEKYHTQSIDKSGKILLSIPALEIKMFAISRKLKGCIAYTLDPDKQRHYSTIFFRLLLEDLYYMSMNTIGFQMIFLRANDEGEYLYRKNNFVDCDEYLSSFDAKAEGCTSLAITLTEIENIIFQ